MYYSTCISTQPGQKAAAASQKPVVSGHFYRMIHTADTELASHLYFEIVEGAPDADR
jgi:hypothetical protein